MARGQILESDLQGIDVYEEPLAETSVTEESDIVFKPYEFSNAYVTEENYSSSNTVSGRGGFRKNVEKINNKGTIFQSGEVLVKGKFNENNIILPNFDLSSITPIPSVSFKFILKTKYKDPETNRITTKLFTSSKTYEYLQNAKLRNIPYPATSILSEVVEIDINPIVDKVVNLRQEEFTNNVFIEKNVFLIFNDLSDSFEIDYPSLLKYIDWVVTKSSANYDERLLPIDEISSLQVDNNGETDTTDNTQGDDGNGNNGDGNGDSSGPPTTGLPELTDCQIVNNSLVPGSEGGPPASKVTAICNGVSYTWNGVQWFADTTNNEGLPQGGSGNQGSGGGASGGSGGTGGGRGDNGLPGRS